MTRASAKGAPSGRAPWPSRTPSSRHAARNGEPERGDSALAAPGRETDHLERRLRSSTRAVPENAPPSHEFRQRNRPAEHPAGQATGKGHPREGPSHSTGGDQRGAAAWEVTGVCRCTGVANLQRTPLAGLPPLEKTAVDPKKTVARRADLLQSTRLLESPPEQRAALRCRRVVLAELHRWRT